MVNYVFKSYNPESPTLFTNEKKRLKQFLTGNCHIEHFGSSAVLNLGGKGIIDIYVIVPITEIEKTKQILEKTCSYEFRPHSGTQRRFVFIREGKNANGEVQRYHLHLTDPDCFDYKKDIVFRDYLRTHPEELKKYAAIKRQAAKQANQSKEAYMAIKTPVIQEILTKALAENKD